MCYILIYNSLDLNDRNLYHQIRLRRGVHIPSTNKLIWDSMSFDGSNILDGWVSYFQTLATPNLEADFGDVDNMLQVEVELSDILSSFHSPSLDDVVSILPDQIRRAIISPYFVRRQLGLICSPLNIS